MNDKKIALKRKRFWLKPEYKIVKTQSAGQWCQDTCAVIWAVNWTLTASGPGAPAGDAGAAGAGWGQGCGEARECVPERTRTTQQRPRAASRHRDRKQSTRRGSKLLGERAPSNTPENGHGLGLGSERRSRRTRDPHAVSAPTLKDAWPGVEKRGRHTGPRLPNPR